MWRFFFSRSPLKQVHHGGVEKFHFGFQGVYVCMHICIAYIFIYMSICTYGSPPSKCLPLYICMSTRYRLHIASIHENTQGWKSSPWRQCPYILRCRDVSEVSKLGFSFPSKTLDAPNLLTIFFNPQSFFQTPGKTSFNLWNNKFPDVLGIRVPGRSRAGIFRWLWWFSSCGFRG